MSYKFSIFYDDECTLYIKSNLILDALSNINKEFNTSYQDIEGFIEDKINNDTSFQHDYFTLHAGICEKNKDFMIEFGGTTDKNFDSITFFKMLEVISPYCRNYKFSYKSYAKDDIGFFNYASSIDGKFLIEKIKIESFSS